MAKNTPGFNKFSRTKYNIQPFCLGMRNLVLLLVFWASLSVANAQQAAVVKFDKVEKILSATTPEIQVINFWATWCAPCVKELPLFESLNAEKRKDVKITLISLDFAEKI